MLSRTKPAWISHRPWEDPRPHVWSICAACFCPCISQSRARSSPPSYEPIVLEHHRPVYPAVLGRSRTRILSLSLSISLSPSLSLSLSLFLSLSRCRSLSRRCALSLFFCHTHSHTQEVAVAFAWRRELSREPNLSMYHSTPNLHFFFFFSSLDSSLSATAVL